MKAVIFLSNNWEWSGGFQQYLDWNGLVPDELNNRKLDWDELRDIVARFYVCYECKAGYMDQVRFVLGRTNKITRRKYTNDPTIMAWELANEPRPMRPGARDRYVEWIRDVAAAIKSLDKNHLVTIGHEGWVGTEGMDLFEEVHRDPNIDYLTIHIWAKNWQWYSGNNYAEAFPKAMQYIDDHIAVAKRLNKPLVIEEFGLPRDVLIRDAETRGRGDAAKDVHAKSQSRKEDPSYVPGSRTVLRDRYYEKIFSYVGTGPVAGANFWAFGGTARPIKGQVFWKPGDEYMGDPPMEEQGLNTVFDSDRSTWKIIRGAASSANRRRRTSAN
jgi:mannan endo-1,4-beta-mannosidase